ncbi:hypothetical protein GUJ93_ZPchr0010g9267 [Zizania palustris]|uniref:Uncharacterized protein n=1 Tax=Zizania palustris TaxID=103762 RepID=A0A8J5WAW9_ZIZPA|nr:hypothetical protein GUJ93_ZPchr0010g9267 [Zizania palustris]
MSSSIEAMLASRSSCSPSSPAKSLARPQSSQEFSPRVRTHPWTSTARRLDRRGGAEAGCWEYRTAAVGVDLVVASAGVSGGGGWRLDFANTGNIKHRRQAVFVGLFEAARVSEWAVFAKLAGPSHSWQI